jgi:nitroimidazol reductase NimA-like FMN-containing flavoprotein (pyridoxamine 5'-phosphate oxidase superfamily)
LNELPPSAQQAPPASPASSAGRAGAPAPSQRVRLRRRRERGSHERDVIDAILDEALVAHVGITDPEGRPLVIPTLHARSGDLLYLHGSAAGRTMRALMSGQPACVTVSLIDGLVLARSAMHHSANYRSVVLLGSARGVEDPAEKLQAFRAIVEHIVPGRWGEVRQPTDNELKATAVAAMAIDEASAKVRSGPPLDDEEDYSLPVWAGVIPLVTRAGAAVADPRLSDAIEPPPHVLGYVRPRSRRAAASVPAGT